MELTVFNNVISLVELVEIFLWLLPFVLTMGVNMLVDHNTTLPREYHRKFVHVVSGLLLISATWYLEINQLVVLAFFLAVGDTLARSLQIGSVHKVERRTIGTVLFPLSFLVLVVLFGEHNMELVRYGMWVLVVPDALAALMGTQWGRQLPRWNKSFLGSATFFLSLFIVTYVATESLFVTLVTSVVLTTVEFFSLWGLDNLLLPIVGSGLLFVLV